MDEQQLLFDKLTLCIQDFLSSSIEQRISFFSNLDKLVKSRLNRQWSEVISTLTELPNFTSENLIYSDFETHISPLIDCFDRFYAIDITNNSCITTILSSLSLLKMEIYDFNETLFDSNFLIY